MHTPRSQPWAGMAAAMHPATQEHHRPRASHAQEHQSPRASHAHDGVGRLAEAAARASHAQEHQSPRASHAQEHQSPRASHAHEWTPTARASRAQEHPRRPDALAVMHPTLTPTTPPTTPRALAPRPCVFTPCAPLSPRASRAQEHQSRPDARRGLGLGLGGAAAGNQRCVIRWTAVSIMCFNPEVCFNHVFQSRANVRDALARRFCGASSHAASRLSSLETRGQEYARASAPESITRGSASVAASRRS